MRCLFTGNIKIKLLKIITILTITNLTLANVNHKNANTGYSKYLLVSADINELYGVIKTLHIQKYQTHFSSLPFYAYYSKYANKTIHLNFTDNPNSLLAYRKDMQQSSQILGQKIKQLLDSNQI